MLISTIVAVAVGITPIKESGSPQLVQVDEAKIAEQVGRFTQETRKDGSTRVRGFDRLGRAYELAVDSKGHVQGHVGDWVVTFDVKEAA
jgi:hypothetical protein